ncbi:hypothetical protein MON38_17530 [Hymenobacter sp. DH14]|uniref:Uncharacterized protein n=1 Tax=Hymenobacter cyanobacteriorum TaxID=2926463 RepID=A0A9X1VHF1_9BACT|nr:hypothetical protein [Hymenobacter cyanobacteriorum]MCI1189229.1 hypothetical protein [Hymenobacter cyanobacteriorum]
MAADVTLLTTKAECDQALDSLTKEKATYAYRDYTQTYADGRATERATTVAAQLAKATDDVAHYTTEAARTGLTPVELRAAKRALIAATSRRDNLTLSSETTSGPTAYLADVDADQVDAQIATLD